MQWRYDVSGIDTVTLHFGQRIDAALVAPIHRAAIALKASLDSRLLDAVPSYTTLMLRYDLLQDDLASLMGQVSEVLNQLPDANGGLDANTEPDAESEIIEVPVFYHSSVGPDLQRLAQRAGFSVEEVIRRHSERLYQVFAIGFAPGFAYLGEVAEELSVPRLANPRAKVPAGTLGIADTQTALYPMVSPGGWNLIGRTPLTLFDQSREQLSLLEAGQAVRFRPIARDEYLELGGRLDDLPWGVESDLAQQNTTAEKQGEKS
jgi:KipI family sensor histidine kinase inhibitor